MGQLVSQLVSGWQCRKAFESAINENMHFYSLCTVKTQIWHLSMSPSDKDQESRPMMCITPLLERAALYVHQVQLYPHTHRSRKRRAAVQSPKYKYPRL